MIVAIITVVVKVFISNYVVKINSSLLGAMLRRGLMVGVEGLWFTSQFLSLV